MSTVAGMGNPSPASPTHPVHRQGGFTLIELILTASILALLAGALAPMVQRQMLKSRDVRRLTDIQSVALAIDEFYRDHGRWPAPNPNASAGGWDISSDGNFIAELREAGYLQADVLDPLNDSTYHYRYYTYAQGAFGCGGLEPYYVLGIRNFESPEFGAQNAGFFACSGRDWSSDFAFVTGGGATP